MRLPLLLAAVAAAVAALASRTHDIHALCTQTCPFQNGTEGDYDVGCGTECKIEQCSRGCLSWQKALETSCQFICNGTQHYLPPKELYCIVGCNDAVNRYFQRLRDEIGTPPPPALVADSLTATSLRLEWEGPKYNNISYLVQWRYEELAGAWQYCRNQSWGPYPTVLVENLIPYTKYRFRIALLLPHQHTELIVSEPSVVISTLPSGVPSSPPTIVRATAADYSRISVSWEPGPFTNGPVLSYVLQITELPLGYSALKDISSSGTTESYMFGNLKPNQEYKITVAMRNAAGVGPHASTTLSTPNEDMVKDTTLPVLIVGAQNTVIKRIADILEEPLVIYNTSSTIKGVGIHVSKELLFVSDSKGNVIKTSLKHRHHHYQHHQEIIITASSANFKPFDLSVDWLNDHLYILGQVQHSSEVRWQIARCGFDGRGLTVAVAGFLTKPLHMEVDPYNGYLFWVVSGSSKPGLYRLDLADISNGVKHEITPDFILDDANLGAFTVDHKKFHLLVASQLENTVIAVSLDGRETVDYRPNTQQPMFQSVLALTIANGLFFWTNGRDVLTEEYHKTQDSYYHTAYPSPPYQGRVTTINVYTPTSQPIPVPVNPPTHVQAVLGPEIAKVSWQEPHLLGGQGKGAWQNWSYEVHIRNEADNVTIIRKGINTTSYTIQNLKENTEYIFKAAAYTTAGLGPWSSEFKGKTLRKSSEGQAASILWSSSKGLLRTDVTGDNVQLLLHESTREPYKIEYNITDIAWYEDKLFLVTNTSNVHWYNLSSHKSGRLLDIDSVGSIAIDWIAKKLYWSNPKQQLISRANFNGSQQETLRILTVAKELSIDAVEAYIYWSTGLSVECARLNGEDLHIYYPAELFSGKQVMGLTLDLEEKYLYWIVRSHEGSMLFQAPTAERLHAKENIKPKAMSYLQYSTLKGSLCYFSDHLLWLQDEKNAIIADTKGQNAAVINGLGLSDLNMVAVRDPALHKYPSITCCSTINVIPESVNQVSIKIYGSWNSFSVQWDPVINVNYGQVFYEVKIDFPSKEIIQITSKPIIKCPESNDLIPYSKLHVSIVAYTYWGTSVKVSKSLYSPPSLPTEPENPRVFISHVKNPVKGDQDIIAVFRWDIPLNPNGPIEGYVVKCWEVVYDNEEPICSVILSPDKMEYITHGLSKNSTYYFQVQAFTSSGLGPFSNRVRADTEIEMPVPKLLLSTSDSVRITDCDKHENQTLSLNSEHPIDLAFLSHENKVFWLNQLQALYWSYTDGKNKTKLFTLNNTGLSLSVDWISRHIYWSEANKFDRGSTIFSLDLNQAEKGRIYSKEILKRPEFIRQIDVSPYRSCLYWTEEHENGSHYLMTSKMNGKEIRPFFATYVNRKRRKSDELQICSCPDNEDIGSAMAIDQTDYWNPKVIWVHKQQHHVFVAEADGCHCTMLVNASSTENTGLPPTSITTDHRLLYWSNATEGRVYSTPKHVETPNAANMGTIVSSVDISGVQQIAAMGTHLQPFPNPKCLQPEQIPKKVIFLNSTNDEIFLALPSAQRYDECINISIATIEYTIYFGLSKDDDSVACNYNVIYCNKVKTYETVISISGLKPFSKYAFYVSLNNYYSELEGIIPTIGPQEEYFTAAGAPSPPRNVTFKVLNPTMVEITWLPPSEFNDVDVWYKIHWYTDGYISVMKQDVEHTKSNKQLSVVLTKLSPSQSYVVWIKAYSQTTNMSSESAKVELTTYPEPNNIQFLNATSSSLHLSWISSDNISRPIMQCHIASMTNNSSLIESSHENAVNNIYIFYFGNLQPKTQYSCKLKLNYSTFTESYIWPQDRRFTYETLGDRPGPPGVPIAQHLNRDIYQLVWDPSLENGAQIELYNLEGRREGFGREKRETNFTNEEPLYNTIDIEWTTYYNGTDNYWIITDLSPRLRYLFRVRSKNRYGWSDFSPTSDSFDFMEAAKVAQQQQLGIVLGVSIPILTVFISVIAILSFVCVFQRREKEKKILQALTLATVPRGPDIELATLRELPRRSNFIQNTNALYSISDVPSDEELALLPHIRRDQINLTKFLGSGAFGEVFEGKARNLLESEEETRVAIKTLRKGATDQEKSEFLKEAQLMSNFKHEHILQLLGVCLDNDPNFIIMELMEGGDLLSFLRSSRPHLYSSNGLTLLDLLAMCVDVARGCRYLEEMHFVHRDLACRNCLVSSSEPQNRIVKIGDFGLARDIYKNDYYRKEGEGLLPVRWMAPESLVDGVFTSQSDVWAFGVLTWEIMTIGQQPYPARTNLEVLHYVRNGGRLGRPSNCPDELHQLMIKTWSYDPERRPTFKYCLEVLEDLKRNVRDVTLTSSLNGHYLSRTNNDGSWKPRNNEDNQEQLPLPPSSSQLIFSSVVSSDSSQNQQSDENDSINPVLTETPRYLELVNDSDTTSISDGYEIPRSVNSSTRDKNSTIRSRAFSVSSVISDTSAKALETYQTVSYVDKINKQGMLSKNSENILSEIVHNECITPVKVDNLSDIWKQENNLLSLEQLIPSSNSSKSKKDNSTSERTISVPTKITGLITYSNILKQPLIEEQRSLSEERNMQDLQKIINYQLSVNNYASSKPVV